MSGRSAYVRAKTGQIAEKKARAQHHYYGHNDDFIHGISGNPTGKHAVFINPPDGQSLRRRHSVSSGGSTYTYMPTTQARKTPRPIIVASAIEKSDFRTHLDGMSKSVRGKLGRLIKGSNDHHNAPTPPPPVVSNNSDTASRSTGFTPSVTAVPSLEPGTPPNEPQGLFGNITSSASTITPKAKYHQHSTTTMPIRRFEGGGKGPQPGWKLLSNVRCLCCVGLKTANDLRIRNCGMTMETLTSTCICGVRKRNHHHRSVSALRRYTSLDQELLSTSCAIAPSPKGGRVSVLVIYPLLKIQTLRTIRIRQLNCLDI